MTTISNRQAILQGLAKHGKHGCWCMSLDPNQQWIRVVGLHTRGKNNGWSGGEQTAQGGNVKECNICKGNVEKKKNMEWMKTGAGQKRGGRRETRHVKKNVRKAEGERPTSRSPFISYKVGHAHIKQSQLKRL